MKDKFKFVEYSYNLDIARVYLKFLQKKLKDISFFEENSGQVVSIISFLGD